jgi:hypothetical protein
LQAYRIAGKAWRPSDTKLGIIWSEADQSSNTDAVFANA